MCARLTAAFRATAVPVRGTHRTRIAAVSVRDPLSDEQREIREHVRTLARERIAPRAHEIDKTAEFPWDVVELFRENDVFGVMYEEAYGGIGESALMTLVTVEELFFGLAWRPNPRIHAWLERFVEERCEVLPVTAAVARRAGELRGHAQARGLVHTQADMLIAATAEVHHGRTTTVACGIGHPLQH